MYPKHLQLFVDKQIIDYQLILPIKWNLLLVVCLVGGLKSMLYFVDIESRQINIKYCVTITIFLLYFLKNIL